MPLNRSLCFTMMDGTTVETQTEERRPERLLMSYGKVHNLMRKTRRSGGVTLMSP
jgi:hypothetical protein